MVIRTAVVDDHSLVGRAMAGALETFDDVDVVGIAADLDEAEALLRRLRPDVVLVDLRIAGRNALEAFPALRAASPSSRLLVVTAWPSEHVVGSALEQGGSGLLSKSQSLDELVDGVRRVHAGEIVVSQDLIGALVRTARQGTDVAAPDVRDVEVLELLAEARTTGDIARTLCLSEHAVRNRIRACMAKLDSHTRIAAVTEATRRGWLPPREPDLCGRWR